MSHLRNSSFGYLLGGGEDIPERHAGGGSHLSQPVPMVQCGGAGAQKGWVPPLLCRLLQVECTHEKGFIPIAEDLGGAQEHGRHWPLLHDEFYEWVLASPHGAWVTAIYHLHGGEPRVL